MGRAQISQKKTICLLGRGTISLTKTQHFSKAIGCTKSIVAYRERLPIRSRTLCSACRSDQLSLWRTTLERSGGTRPGPRRICV